MFVGGPNERKDYHIEEGEEFFYMVKGDMCLKIMEKGIPRDIPIKEGEMFVLPSRIPHSPQRAEDTLGLVIERERLLSEMDGLQFFCEDGVTVLYQEWFHCKDLGTQLAPIIERFKSSEECKTGKPNADTMKESIPLKINTTEVTPPISLNEWLSQHSVDIKTSGSSEVFGKGEFKISVVGAGSDQISSKGHETFLWQLVRPNILCSINRLGLSRLYLRKEIALCHLHLITGHVHCMRMIPFS
jgi:3-hydroxyanthranilate 3,4-dioxygenase